MSQREERGAALALVLWGLVIAGALLTVSAVLAVQEQRAAHALRRQQRTFVDAEAVGAAVLSRWTAGALRQGLPRSFDSLTLDAGPGWDATVRRLTAAVFLLEVSTRDTLGGSASREAADARMGWLVQPLPLAIPLAGAVSVGGEAVLGDQVAVSGIDDVPPGRGCPPSDSAVPGVVAAGVQANGSVSLTGAPSELLRSAADSGLAASDLVSFTALATRATIVLPGGRYATNPATVGTLCDIQDSSNWGDSERTGTPCADYLPIINVKGDVTLDGGSGQGILLVQGNLTVSSDYHFDGLVFVRGTIVTAAYLDVRGAVATAFLGSRAAPMSRFTVRYSKCIVSNALGTSSRLVPLASRAWKQLF